MSTSRSIIVHLERLKMYDQDSKAAFGATLLVGAKGVDLTDQYFLQPWFWGAIEKFRCMFLKADGTLIRTNPADSTSPPFTSDSDKATFPGTLPDFGNDLAALTDAMVYELTQGKTVPQALMEQARFDMAYGEVTHTYDPDHPPSKPWQAVLGQMILAPYPAPQLLKLSHQFLVAFPAGLDPATVSFVVAAPVLNAAAAANEKFPADLLEPDAASLQASNQGWSWSYKPKGGDPPMAANVRSCGLTRADDKIADEGVVDFTTLWVNVPASYGSDWRAGLEPKLGLALDLCQRIIEYMRPFDTSVAGVVLPQTADLPMLTDLALASLRDQIGFGLRRGPDGERFINKCLRIAGSAGSVSDQEVQNLAQSVRNQFPTVNDWKAFLISTAAGIPELAKLSILNNVPLQPAEAGSQLQTLHTILLGGDGSNLAKLFVNLWRALPAATRPVALTNPILATIQGLSTQIGFRQQLSQELLGLFWSDFLNSAPASDADLFEQKFPALVLGYFNRRFGISGAALNLFPALQVADATKVKTLQETITTWAKLYAAQLRPDSLNAESTAIGNGNGTIGLATTVPHNLSTQLGRLAALPPKPDNSDDVLAHVNGFCALMRRNPESRWRCLNLAKAEVAQPGKPDGYQLAGKHAVLVPARLSYVNELRQMLLTYSNEPVSATSPLIQPIMSNTRLSGSQNTLPDPVMKYPFSTEPAALMPGLRFGETYQMAFFAVSKSGVLPKGLGNSALAFVDLSKTSIEVPAPNIAQVTYKRRVAIGQMRVFNEGEGGKRQPKNLTLPVIPDTVHPRAREIPHADRQQDTPLLLLPSDAMAKYNPGLSAKFTFEFRMPSTDRETWLRWVFKASDDPVQRSAAADFEGQVLGDFYKLAAQGNNQNARPDVSFDDPALLRNNTTGNFLARVETLNADYGWDPAKGADGNPIQVWIPAEQPSFPQTGILAFQRKPVSVTCTVGLTVSLTLTGTGPYKLTMQGVEGMVHRLTIFNCIEVSDFQRFEVSKAGTSPIVSYDSAVPVKVNGTGPDVFLVSPFRLTCEVATAALIPDPDKAGDPAALALDSIRTADNLYGCIVASPFNPVETRIELNVQQGTGAQFRDFRYLYRMEIRRQVWRWQGRPAVPHPQLEPGVASTRDWEAIEFGEISETDYVVYPFAPTGSGKTKGFLYQEQLGGPQNQGDRRGLAFRFAVQAYSRYEGWLPPDLASVLAASRSSTADPGTSWKHYFVPPRPQTPLPAPKVRLIFPLTERFDKSATASAPGLLVVLDEPWFERGGLGEKLTAEVQLSADPRLPPDTNKTFFFETGPDPLFSGATKALSPQKAEDPNAANVSKADVTYKAKASFSPDAILGPVGHTLSTGNASPLFVASSFVIPAPTIEVTTDKGTTEKTTDLRGYFCKLRLRRTVRLNVTGDTLTSDPTEPYWVQYLPEFSFYDSAAGYVNRLKVRLASKTADSKFVAELVNDQGAPETLQPFKFKDAPNTHALYLVLTRLVYDVTGRPDQEVFFALCRQQGAQWLTDEPVADAGLSDASRTSIRARVVEVQIPTGVAPPAAMAAAFWQALFPDPTADNATLKDSKTRIVRISRPINSNLQAQVCAGQ